MSRDVEAIRTELNQRGWLTRADVDEGAARQLATALGTPTPSRPGTSAFETLRPRRPEEANAYSLSARFGTGAFPFHTDTAHWLEPARYVVMWAWEASDCATRVVDTHAWTRDSPGVRDLLERAVFAVANGTRSFLTNMWCTRKERIRFDPVCLRPVDRAAQQARATLAELLSQSPGHAVTWRGGTLLVVDNWRCMHARDSVSPAALSLSSRRLLRVLVREKE